MEIDYLDPNTNIDDFVIPLNINYSQEIFQDIFYKYYNKEVKSNYTSYDACSELKEYFTDFFKNQWPLSKHFMLGWYSPKSRPNKNSVPIHIDYDVASIVIPILGCTKECLTNIFLPVNELNLNNSNRAILPQGEFKHIASFAFTNQICLLNTGMCHNIWKTSTTDTIRYLWRCESNLSWNDAKRIILEANNSTNEFPPNI